MESPEAVWSRCGWRACAECEYSCLLAEEQYGNPLFHYDMSLLHCSSSLERTSFLCIILCSQAKPIQGCPIELPHRTFRTIRSFTRPTGIVWTE